MNKPYTCHNCSTEFDVYPADMAERIGRFTAPARVKVRCPGCYEAGYTSVPGVVSPPGSLGAMVYTIDLGTMQLIEGG
jgi:hypothetical protein